MSEEEAKKKACPFAKNFGASQQVAEGPGPHCVGSACMAWRGKEQPWFTNRAEAEFRRTGRRLEPTGADIDGFCGLAGAPQ